MLVEERRIGCDVLVAGGGMAGVCCALAAARCGAQVVLCQDRPVLGGNASSEIRMHIVGADAGGWRGSALETEAREGGLLEEIRLESCARNPHRSASMQDLILYEKCRCEPNLRLLLDTTVTGVRMEGGCIASAVAERPSTEDRFLLDAAIFVDCAGDGRLGAEAGAAFRHGREGRDEWDESLAEQRGDARTLGSSLLFQARNVGYPVPFEAPPWARRFTEDDLRLRHHASTGTDRGLEYGYWWVEWGGTLDTIKDNQTIRDELTGILLGVWDHIKNGGDHGAEMWALDWMGFVPGKRESRRFVGEYVLKQQDLIESAAFDDAIAFGGWPIDVHPTEGIDAVGEPPCTQQKVPHLYDIPLRSCISASVPNLMFAGRNLSASHIAFASTRVMGTCAVVGQGVGVAAAHAAEAGIIPGEIVRKVARMRHVQQRLLRDDAFLIGLKNEDPQDRARGATVTASSAQPDGEAQNVLTGSTRAVWGSRGAPEARAPAGTHRWMSDSPAGFPAWILLTWDQPVEVEEIQLIFDTGLHRPLTLSHSDGFVERMKWGAPQPETVRDYRIEGCIEGQWRALAEVEQNYQRRRVHRWAPPMMLEAMRLVVVASNGLDHARVCEVRAYGPPDAATKG